MHVLTLHYRIQMYFGTVWTVWAPKNVPKKVLVTLFPYIFHVKTKWNIVYECLKTTIFSRGSNILPQMHWTSNIFGDSAPIIRVFWVSLNYSILNFKKTVCPKNVWMRYCPSNLCRFLSEYFIPERFLSKQNLLFDKSRVLVYTF